METDRIAGRGADPPMQHVVLRSFRERSLELERVALLRYFLWLEKSPGRETRRNYNEAQSNQILA